MSARLQNKLERWWLRQSEGMLDDLGEEQREHLAGLLGEVAARSEEVVAAETRLEELNRRLADLDVYTADWMGQVERLLAEVGRRDRMLRERDDELTAVRVRAAELEQRLAAAPTVASAELDERAAAIAAAEERLARREVEMIQREIYPEHAQELERRENALDERERSVAAREERLDTLQGFVERERSRLRRAQDEVADVGRELAAKERTLEERTAQLALETERAALYEEGLARREQQLREAEERLTRRTLEVGEFVAGVQSSLGR